MRRSVAAAFVLMIATTPVLADPPAPTDTAMVAPVAAPVKMKKVCRAVAGGDNPLFPQLKCHQVPVATSASVTEVAMQGAPHP